MFKLYAFWSAPAEADAAEFDRRYTEGHGPLAMKVPGMKRFVTTRTDVGLEGGEPAFFRVAEMVFDSREDLERAEHSEEWGALRADSGAMIERFGVTLTVAMGEEIQHPLGG
jgi:uncharacterized protein (TIGR02118 family)